MIRTAGSGSLRAGARALKTALMKINKEKNNVAGNTSTLTAGIRRYEELLELMYCAPQLQISADRIYKVAGLTLFEKIRRDQECL